MGWTTAFFLADLADLTDLVDLTDFKEEMLRFAALSYWILVYLTGIMGFLLTIEVLTLFKGLFSKTGLILFLEEFLAKGVAINVFLGSISLELPVIETTFINFWTFFSLFLATDF